ncbi:MAG: ricin-type beta-trefoil lectin domain protein [Actinophytocola sp.]|uniref:protein kinase domain-containing protein n=1 Tax=Actinophytocola sp. TaxID=1872138 RepID=UPI003C72897A
MRSLGDSDPRHVGPYRLLAGLDSDEMGPVLLGTGPDGRLVAIKLVNAHLAADGGFGQRLAREVAALRNVPGAQVVDADPAGTWLASEFVPGPSLRELIERGVLLGDDALLLLAAGLVGALTGTHRAGLVHRDLTPVNVRLTGDSVRVLDFGVARALDRDVSQVVGAPEFMSPEQASGQPVTAASDIFSLGVVLHLAATGRSPFAGATRAETLALVVAAQPELSPSLPSRVRQLMAACLVKEPLQRPTLERLRAMIGPIPPGTHPWPALVRSMISEQNAEVARLLGSPVGAGRTHVDAPTTHIAPVVIAPAPPPRRTSSPRRAKPDAEGWRPDTWAVVSGAAVVLTIVFAIVMFNALTPDRPIRASQQETSSAAPTTTTTTTTTTTIPTTTTTTQQALFGQISGLAQKCVDIAGASAATGTPVNLQTCNATNAQQWVFSPDGTVQGLGKCLDVVGGGTTDGAKVQISDCNGTGAQLWSATPQGLIVNVQSNKCLDVPASVTTDGTQLTIWTCHGQANQLWVAPT